MTATASDSNGNSFNRNSNSIVLPLSITPQRQSYKYSRHFFPLSSANLNGRFLCIEVQQVRPRPKCSPFDCAWQMICGLKIRHNFSSSQIDRLDFLSFPTLPLQQLFVILFFLHLIFPRLWLCLWIFHFTAVGVNRYEIDTHRATSFIFGCGCWLFSAPARFPVFCYCFFSFLYHKMRGHHPSWKILFQK